MRRCKRRMPGLRGKGQSGAPTHGVDKKRFTNLDEVLEWWRSQMSSHWAASSIEAGDGGDCPVCQGSACRLV
eukprot:SAG22_NODE_1610_length_4002_cov_2.012298_3_plen_72_part_00